MLTQLTSLACAPALPTGRPIGRPSEDHPCQQSAWNPFGVEANFWRGRRGRMRSSNLLERLLPTFGMDVSTFRVESQHVALKIQDFNAGGSQIQTPRIKFFGPFFQTQNLSKKLPAAGSCWMFKVWERRLLFTVHLSPGLRWTANFNLLFLLTARHPCQKLLQILWEWIAYLRRELLTFGVASLPKVDASAFGVDCLLMAWRLIFGKTFGVEAKPLARHSAWKQPNGVGGQIHCQPLSWMILWGRPYGRPLAGLLLPLCN